MTRVRVVVSSLELGVSKLMQRLALNITSNLIQDTPVDTGWARTNWIPEIAAPFEGTAGTRAAAEKGQLNRGVQERGVERLHTYRLGPTIHITNNVPYINLLNSGSSSQAPAAFVQGAIIRGIFETVR